MFEKSSKLSIRILWLEIIEGEVWALCDVFNTMKPSPLRIVDGSNHDGTEQESFSE